VPRFLVSPRALVLHVLMALCVVVCVFLAVWQWNRAHARVVDPTAAPAVELAELSTPGPALSGRVVGRMVVAEGRYLAQDRYFVTARSRDGVAGEWVLVPLELADGSKVAVVRGFVTDRADPAARTPAGVVVVEGRLQPSEDLTQAPRDAVSDPSGGSLSGVAASELVGLVGRPIHPGWIAAVSETPAPNPAPARLADRELLIPDGGLKLQNVAYTLQWALFGGFVVMVYRRFLLDAWNDYRAADAESSEAGREAAVDGRGADPSATREEMV
jgi:cytochrome oxidase assembly protein ShyY1